MFRNVEGLNICVRLSLLGRVDEGNYVMYYKIYIMDSKGDNSERGGELLRSIGYVKCGKYT